MAFDFDIALTKAVATKYQYLGQRLSVFRPSAGTTFEVEFKQENLTPFDVSRSEVDERVAIPIFWLQRPYIGAPASALPAQPGDEVTYHGRVYVLGKIADGNEDEFMYDSWPK